jgi:group I intron endonuclease
MIIYKTTNIINGKYYIGKDEKNCSKYLGSGKILKLAIKKYGRDNFKKKVLEVCKNRVELNKREKYWINKLDATNTGYNIAEGGTGGKTKLKTVPVYQYNKDGSFIREWDSASEVTKEINLDGSGIMKVCKGKLSSCGGFIWSYKKIINGINSYERSNNIKVLQYSKNGILIKEWESIIAVKKYYNISDRHIQTSLDNINKSAKGFIWLRKFGEIRHKLDIPKRIYSNALKYKKILQLDENKVLIKEWDYVKDIINILNYNSSSIYKSIKTNNKYKGFYWTHKLN